jgi:hypothetical protein
MTPGVLSIAAPRGPVQMQAVTIDTTALSVEHRNALRGAL